jgi:hypothetical protein
MKLEDASKLQKRLLEAIRTLSKKYPSFDEASRSYTAQYGNGSIKVHEPIEISETIDPVIIVLGHTTPLFYHDSKRTLAGTLGVVEIEKKALYILGRREPPDSKLVIWSYAEETEVERYDSRVKTIPSRVHASVFASENGRVLFSDLGSSSGSIVAGESNKPEPFVAMYSTTSVGVRRVIIPSKYPPR